MAGGLQVKEFADLSFTAGTPLTQTFSWTVPRTAATGTYTVTASVKKNGVFLATTQTTFNVVPDSTLPSVPTGLMATAVSISRINLAWTASTDNIGVKNYLVSAMERRSAHPPAPASAI